MSCIAGAVGGGIIGFAGSQGYILGGLGVFGIPNFIEPGSPIGTQFWMVMLAMVVSFVLGLILTLVFGFKDPVETAASVTPVVTQSETLIEQEVLVSPLEGELIPLVNVKDEAFSSGALGKGLGIVPTEGKLYSPANGTVTMVFPTGHAVGITTDSGAEILMHIGMDTVQLEGKYFTVHVKQGDKITAGQLLTEFDIEGIRSEGYDITTPIIVTNTNQYLDVMVVDEEEVKPGDRVITLVI
ncbi:PTS system beta-glucoside-specific transporter subunits IIABC [Listeria grandensis FSL F6-0971]|uniref:PTS system beta-glucoside-specific transporter subunits IIABC n=1 Tax=Listeria grandensis FSL F6-0971 TaxID=1265819 RepID=W7BH29_9LIST|nr:PTS system beta-glucoside-specific transporter subunits IIABC [Listeria grandensis FSL F6-0971]